jgi:hypothetical protein
MPFCSGDIAVAKTLGDFEDKNARIIIMGTLAQGIRLIRKIRRQPLVIKKIGAILENFLFKCLNVDLMSVW